jgi:hypothetical protein
MTPEETSVAVLAAAPYVSRFVGKLFGVEAELASIAEATGERGPLWAFKAQFAKKRVLREGAGKSWKGSGADASAVVGGLPARARRSVRRRRAPHGQGRRGRLRHRRHRAEEREGRRGDVHPGAPRARRVPPASARLRVDHQGRLGPRDGSCGRRRDRRRGRCPSRRSCSTPSRRTSHTGGTITPIRRTDGPRSTPPKNLDFSALVTVARPDAALFVGPAEHRRERDGFAAHRRRAWAPRGRGRGRLLPLLPRSRQRLVLEGPARQQATGEVKKNPLGVDLLRLPARREDLRDAHAAARGRLARRARLDLHRQPDVPGTGHRICNDCMKACIFQKQEPVNIPQAETRVLKDVLELPVGLRDLRRCSRAGTRSTPGATRAPTTARTCSSSGSGPPATRSPTTSRARASA